MDIVFHATRITELAYLVAYLYLKPEVVDNLEQTLAEIALFRTAPLEKGTLYLFNQDRDHNRLFLLGRGKSKEIVIQALQGYSRIFGRKKGFIFFDLSQYENSQIRYSQILKALNLKQIAHFLMLQGIKKELKKISHDLKAFRNTITG